MKGLSLMRTNKTYRAFLSILVVASILFLLPIISTAAQAEKKAKASAAAAEARGPVAVNDANLQASQKRAEDLAKKGDYEGALRTMVKVNDYTKEVLALVKTLHGQYEKAINDGATPQSDKEDLYIKLKRLDQFTPRYSKIYEASVFNLGFLYGKKGDVEKARKYLTEYLQMVPFSSERDSQWMKAKTLLLDLYSLGGEF